MSAVFEDIPNPIPLLDGYIQTGRFTEFINNFQERRIERQKWEFYLNKVPSWSDMSWADFNTALKEQEQREKFSTATPEELGATIRNSKNILNNFNPNDEVV